LLRFDEDLRKSGRNSAELYNNCSLRYNSNVKLRNGGMKEMTIITEKKIGRNEPCWCGSGEKYKTAIMILTEKSIRSVIAGSRSRRVI